MEDRERSASASAADGLTPDYSQSRSMQRLSMAITNGANGAVTDASVDGTMRAGSLDVAWSGYVAEDDPSSFESAKQTLLDGIEKFNFKPKRVFFFFFFLF